MSDMMLQDIYPSPAKAIRPLLVATDSAHFYEAMIMKKTREIDAMDRAVENAIAVLERSRKMIYLAFGLGIVIGLAVAKFF